MPKKASSSTINRATICVCSALQRRLHRQQLFLPHQEREQPDLQPIEVIVHVTQPLVLVLVVALRLVAEENHRLAAVPRAGFLILLIKRIHFVGFDPVSGSE